MFAPEQNASPPDRHVRSPPLGVMLTATPGIGSSAPDDAMASAIAFRNFRYSNRMLFVLRPMRVNQVRRARMATAPNG